MKKLLKIGMLLIPLGSLQAESLPGGSYAAETGDTIHDGFYDGDGRAAVAGCLQRHPGNLGNCVWQHDRRIFPPEDVDALHVDSVDFALKRLKPEMKCLRQHRTWAGFVSERAWRACQHKKMTAAERAEIIENRKDAEEDQ